jgi:hypothetical protein
MHSKKKRITLPLLFLLVAGTLWLATRLDNRLWPPGTRNRA